MSGRGDHVDLGGRGWKDLFTKRRDRIKPTPPDVAGIRNQRAHFVKQLTGTANSKRWWVWGTDLGIPYLLENNSVGYLFGDTFASASPDSQDQWRSPVMLRSNVHPAAPGGIEFDSAAGVAGDGRAAQLMFYVHGDPDNKNPSIEITRIPNDGIAFPETGRQVISYMSVWHWPKGGPWRTRYAGLAYSDNGNDFIDVPTSRWPNDGANMDEFQMWTMQREGNYVYVFTVRPGRQWGPMMLQRVPWQRLMDRSAYQPWGWRKESGWQWGQPCTPILEGAFGEPSVRKLTDGVWAMSYSTEGKIVTRRAEGPDRVWSKEKVQVTWEEQPALYGGFIHPYSSSAVDDLHLMVSTWQKDANGKTTAYHVSHYAGTI